MQRREPSFFFDEKVALEYDRRNEEYAPLLDALHLLMSTIFSDLPADSRVLSVGAGTGSEWIDLAHQFPQWRFTAVEPSAPMLDVCRRRTDECGIASRCDYHEGYLDSLAPSEAFDAATSILVSQFLLDLEARSRFFKAVADRLAPGGYFGERRSGVR